MTMPTNHGRLIGKIKRMIETRVYFEDRSVYSGPCDGSGEWQFLGKVHATDDPTEYFNRMKFNRQQWLSAHPDNAAYCSALIKAGGERRAFLHTIVSTLLGDPDGIYVETEDAGLSIGLEDAVELDRLLSKLMK